MMIAEPNGVVAGGPFNEQDVGSMVVGGRLPGRVGEVTIQRIAELTPTGTEPGPFERSRALSGLALEELSAAPVWARR